MERQERMEPLELEGLLEVSGRREVVLKGGPAPLLAPRPRRLLSHIMTMSLLLQALSPALALALGSALASALASARVPVRATVPTPALTPAPAPAPGSSQPTLSTT